MADEQEIEVKIVSDEESNVQTAVEKENKTGDVNKVEVKDPALQDLMAQYKELETRSQESERRAQEAEDRRIKAEREAALHRRDAETSKKRETTSHLDTITTAISASEQDIDGAKSAIRAAKASGDVEAEIEAQVRLSKAQATLLRLDEAKQDIEARAKAPPKREVPSDPVEAFIQGRTDKTQAWLRAHTEYVRSEKGLKKLNAAHAIAEAEDLIPDTPEYFARVEEYLGIGKKEAKVEKNPTEASQVQPQQKRSAAPPVAPTASVSSSGANGDRTVTLTKREADAATDGTIVWNWTDPNGKFKKGDPIGHQEMARRKLSMQKEGRYDRSFTEG